MISTISNDFLTIQISSLGAELVSVKTKDGKERLWQRDKNVWDGQAPILFPWAGRITNKEFTHNGKKYEGMNHGFMRNTEHSLRIESKDANDNPFITFSANGILEKFPFDFSIEQTYTLIKNKIVHSVHIKNTGENEMPFGLGYHPGFLCPFSEGKTTEDYELVFDIPQSPDYVIVDAGHPTGKTEPYMSDKDRIQLTDTLFEKDSLNFSSFNAKTISLCEKNSTNRIEVSIENFPYLLIWSALTPKIKFVCIEPWHTLPDFKNAVSEWSKKENLLKLAPGNTFDSQIEMSFFFT